MNAVEPWTQFAKDVPRTWLQSEKRSARGRRYQEMLRTVLSQARRRTLNTGDPTKLSGFRLKKGFSALYAREQNKAPKWCPGLLDYPAF